MKEIVSLMDYRSSIKVIDATLRDGGLVNDFYFTDEFVRALYEANIRAGVDYMEMGYKSSKEMFDENKYGKWKFCDDDDIREIVGDNDTSLKIAVMADVGRCDYRKDIVSRSESPIDLIRVATYLNTIPAAADMIEDAKRKGYEVSCNIMAISNGQESDLKVALDILGKTSADVLYIVDSFGSLYPEQIARIADTYMEFASKYGDGVDWLDATYSGMGRGAGNCPMELLLGFLHNPKYNNYFVIHFIEKYMNKLKEDGVVWGFDLQYMMTGLLNQHPRTAIEFTKQKRKDYSEFYKEVVAQD